jgi:NitT/TauT family transport system ATP-binding protein
VGGINMKTVVEIKNISMNYHSLTEETKAIEDLSFSVEQGEFISIVGPSGCGKSTILSLISGLMTPSSGNININGSIGYMLQKDHLFEWRNIQNNIYLGLEIQNKLNAETKAYADKLLDTYGLSDFKKHTPSELSGGMRQRAALIRTLALKPDIMLLDEPFSALDYQTRLYLADEIGIILKKEKKTAILVTHDISEAVAMSDRVLVLTSRPATLKSVHTITLSIKDKTPMKSREAPEFRQYFNTIWKELDIHV